MSKIMTGHINNTYNICLHLRINYYEYIVSENSHFGQSIHALENIFRQRLKVVVSQAPSRQRGHSE